MAFWNEKSRQLGHTKENLVVSCQLFPENVDELYLVEKDCLTFMNFYAHPIYFNCYMLRFNKSYSPQSITLELILFADNFAHSDNAQPGTLFSQSALLIIFNMLESYHEDQVRVLPGQNMEIDISLTYSEQLPSPYGLCLEKPLFDSIWSIDGQKVKYSKVGCFAAHSQHELLDQCGCVSHVAPVLGHKQGTSLNLSYCSISSEFILNCTLTTLTSIYNETSVLCQEKCQQISFHMHKSLLSWLTLQETHSFYMTYIRNKSFEHWFDGNISNFNGNEQKRLYDLIKDNFARVHIKFNLKEIIVYKEVPQFSFTSFIGQLGGILNLYSGVSFVIIIEVADFIMSIFCKCFKSRKIGDVTKL